MDIQTLTSKMNTTPEFSMLSHEQLENIGNAVLNNKMIDAIGLYRDYTGMGLADAKAAVDSCFSLAFGAAEENKPITEPTTEQPKSGFDNGFKIDIKAVLVLIAIAVAVFFVFKSCDSGASGTNIKVIYVDENSVGFYPVCPKCDHVGDAHDVKISPGEDFDTYFFCDNRQCQHMYKVTVERDD